jgi:hypothetical protein
MQQADMRIDASDDLAVELEDHSQHTMRRGMLRSKIDAERAIVRCGRGVVHFFMASWM